jgi:hypothetical protein
MNTCDVDSVSGVMPWVRVVVYTTPSTVSMSQYWRLDGRGGECAALTMLVGQRPVQSGRIRLPIGERKFLQQTGIGNGRFARFDIVERRHTVESRRQIPRMNHRGVAEVESPAASRVIGPRKM